jgi:hypothetical protein
VRLDEKAAKPASTSAVEPTVEAQEQPAEEVATEEAHIVSIVESTVEETAGVPAFIDEVAPPTIDLSEVTPPPPAPEEVPNTEISYEYEQVLRSNHFNKTSTISVRTQNNSRAKRTSSSDRRANSCR